MNDRSPQIRLIAERVVAQQTRCLDDAIEIGRLLTEQKPEVEAELGTGKWVKWLKENVVCPSLCLSLAYQYMKIYEDRDALRISNVRKIGAAIRFVHTKSKQVEKLDQGKSAGPFPSYELYLDDASEVEYEQLIEQVKPVLQTTADEDSVINSFRFVKLMKEATDAGSPLAAYLAIKLGPTKLKALFERLAHEAASHGNDLP